MAGIFSESILRLSQSESHLSRLEGKAAKGAPFHIRIVRVSRRIRDVTVYIKLSSYKKTYSSSRSLINHLYR